MPQGEPRKNMAQEGVKGITRWMGYAQEDAGGNGFRAVIHVKARVEAPQAKGENRQKNPRLFPREFIKIDSASPARQACRPNAVKEKPKNSRLSAAAITKKIMALARGADTQAYAQKLLVELCRIDTTPKPDVAVKSTDDVPAALMRN